MAAAQERLRREEDAAQLDAGSAFDQLSAAPALTRLTAYAAEIAAGAEAGESEEDLEQRARVALECPCVASLRKGPCGAAFSDAFVCFIKSREIEKAQKLHAHLAPFTLPLLFSRPFLLHILLLMLLPTPHGSDCMGPFLAMQACMAANPAHFADYEREEDEEREEEGGESNGQQRPH
eukprot:SM001040S14114  [mRNA]  locus=s1040:201:1445:+ [translate_table: standard]